MINNPVKILIVKIGAIGDVVMTLSVLKAIELKFPDAEITWLCGKTVESVLKGFSQIKIIISLDEKNLLTGNISIRLWEIIKTWIKLFLKKYDLTLIPYRDTRYKILTFFTFTGKLKDMSARHRMNSFIPGRYHAAEYAKLILEEDDSEMQEIGFPEIHLTPVRSINDELIKLTGKKIVLAPGGAKNLINGGELRRWPIEYYRSLAEFLIIEGFDIILIGSEQDRWVLDYFNGLQIKNLIGKTRLTDLIYLFQKCDILVTHDTGALHLAKLTKIKTIGLFGPVNPHERVGTKENIEVIYAGNDLPCSPCYDGKNFADCNNNICMQNIDVDIVFRSVTKQFEE